MSFSKYLKKGPVPAKILLAILGPVLLIFLLENMTRLAIKAGWIEYQQPMITQLPPGTEDWRKAHMTADSLRQPDPVLWWRPRNSPPYNSQGFKGPVVTNPKNSNTIRIVVYGDSNTEGTPEDSWPDRLQKALLLVKNNRNYEVLNAGVAGYTSHQGLLRFQQEVRNYTPDIVLVAFGWNDLANAVRPDKSYVPPHPAFVFCERLVLKLRFYWALKQTALPKPSSNNQQQQTIARVSIEDYAANLRQFLKLGREVNANVVLVTRPHRESNESLRKYELNYRAEVPAYNETLLGLCRQQNANCIDAEKYFLATSDPDVWGDECHFTEKGRIEMGEFVFLELKRFGLL
ncbi:MAG TPA: SGNH/GDSL hydrolase family protein [Anaerolineales bacterium]|nr:SGNH/GDSL hydrolase family protein [Anaerolineales bacterium]